MVLRVISTMAGTEEVLEEKERKQEGGRRKKRRRRRRRRRRGRSQLQCSLLQQCSRVVFVSQGNCFFPVNKEGEEEEEKVEAKNKHQEEEEMRTTIQSCVAMRPSCTCAPRQLFLSSGGGEGGGRGGERRGGGGGGEARGGGSGGGGRGRDHNYNASYHSNAAEIYLCPRQLFLSSEEGRGGEKGGERGGG